MSFGLLVFNTSALPGLRLVNLPALAFRVLELQVLSTIHNLKRRRLNERVGYMYGYFTKTKKRAALCSKSVNFVSFS